MTSITITLPIPDKGLSPNARVHWAKKAKLTKAARDTAKMFALAALLPLPRPRWDKATYKAYFYFKTAAARDSDNAMASLKSSLDGIADAGIVSNDKALWPERPVILKDKDNPRVVLVITREL